MEQTREKLQKFSKVIFIFAKIGYVASIVGASLCACAMLWMAIFGSTTQEIQLGGVTLHGLIVESGANAATLWGEVSYTLTYCLLLIPVLYPAMRLFANIRDQYTPFTTENAELFKTIAIRMIVASVVPPIVGYAVGNGCAKLMEMSFDTEFGNGFSMVAVLVLFAMSMVFRYGCALQEQADTTL